MSDWVANGQIWTIVSVTIGAAVWIGTHIWSASRWKTAMESAVKAQEATMEAQFREFVTALAHNTKELERIQADSVKAQADMQSKSDERTQRLHKAIDGVNDHLGDQDVKIARLDAHHEDNQKRFERVESKLDRLNGHEHGH